jgi:hypothetical protein
MRRSSKLNAIVCAMIFAAAVSASAKEGETRKTTFGGQAVCGDLVIGLEAGLEKRADEICADEAEKRNQHQYPVDAMTDWGRSWLRSDPCRCVADI